MINIAEYILVILTIFIIAFLSVYNVKIEIKDTIFTKYYIFKYWNVIDYNIKEIILWKQKKT